MLTKENCGNNFENVPNNSEGIKFMIIQARGNIVQIERYMGIERGDIDEFIHGNGMPPDMFELFMRVCHRFF